MVSPSPGSPADHRLSVRIVGRARRHRALLPFYTFRLGQAMTAALPRPIAHAAVAAVGELATRWRPRRFDGLRDNLRRVVPGADPALVERLVRANVRGLLCRWVDVMQMSSHPARAGRRVYTVDLQHVRQALERNHGVVLVSAHLGAWETGVSACALTGSTLAVLAERLHPPELFKKLVAARRGLGVQVIPIDTAAMRAADSATARRIGAGAMREVVRVLRRNGIVAIAVDRDLAGSGMLMEFFGAPAPIPDGIVDVAIRTGAAIVPAFTIDEGRQARAEVHPEVTYDPAASRPAEIRRVTAAVLQVTESVIRRHPDQWHVLDPIWPEREDPSLIDTMRESVSG